MDSSRLTQVSVLFGGWQPRKWLAAQTGTSSHQCTMLRMVNKTSCGMTVFIHVRNSFISVANWSMFRLNARPASPLSPTNSADPRVEDWPLMKRPQTTAGLCLAYIFILWAGKRVMMHRPPLALYPSHDAAFLSWSK